MVQRVRYGWLADWAVQLPEEVRSHGLESSAITYALVISACGMVGWQGVPCCSMRSCSAYLVGKVISSVFNSAAPGDQELCDYGAPTITTLDGMLAEASSFNQAIGARDTSAVTTVRSMFNSASSFSQKVGNWDTSIVTTMESMFNGASNVGQAIDNWNTSVVSTLECMFARASSFSQALGNWDTSRVTNMECIVDIASSCI